MKAKRGKGDSDIRSHRTSADPAAPPRITVMEGAMEAEPAALDDVLELLVKWAIRGAQSPLHGGD